MNLYIFPSQPVTTNGYGIAVKSDLERLNTTADDLIIWYDYRQEKIYENDVVLLRPSKFALSRFINILKNKVNCEVYEKSLSKFDLQSVNEIFCGEVIFYRALRKLFPNKKITVRFHNCYARIKDRLRLIDTNVNLKMRIDLNAFYQLEKEIFQDRNTTKIFISNEDRDYYTSNFGIYSDSIVWGFSPNMEQAIKNRNSSKKNKIVHFGGLQAHKVDGIKWFINDIFIQLRSKYPNIEFHLYGSGTINFNSPSDGVYGHGFYDGDSLPDLEDGLFINPDSLGLGVKIKLIDLFEKGASFISTPYGYEGYDRKYIDNMHYFIVEKDKWLTFLIDYFRHLHS